MTNAGYLEYAINTVCDERNHAESRLADILATIREVHATLKTTLGYAEQDSIAIHSSVEKLEKCL